MKLTRFKQLKMNKKEKGLLIKFKNNLLLNNNNMYKCNKSHPNKSKITFRKIRNLKFNENLSIKQNNIHKLLFENKYQLIINNSKIIH